jgi:hypothetical protein
MDERVHVRYMVSAVPKALDLYSRHLSFTVESDYSPALASVLPGNLRLLLAGPQSSACRPMPDGAVPGPAVGTESI